MSKQECSPVEPTEEHQRKIAEPVGYFELLRHNSNFRYLWSGQIVSLLGDRFNVIAAAILIARLTGSGLAVGILFAIRLLAPFFIAPIAGICADRYNRKHLLIITDILCAFIVFGFLFVQDENDVWLLYTLSTFLSAVTGFHTPARSAILPDVTSARELGTANTLGSVTWSVMLAVGAAIGGITTGLFGSQTAFIIDALTFFISASFLLPIKLPGPSSAASGTPTQARLTALRYMLQHPDILFIAMHKAAISLLISTSVQIILVEISQKYFVIGVGGAISLGMMYSASGVGSSIGPLLARRWTGDRDKPLRISISLGYVIAAVGIAILATLFNFQTVLIGVIVRSVGLGIVWVFSTLLLLQNTPNEIRGRVFGTEFSLFTIMGGASSMIVGALLDRLPIGSVIWGVAGLSLIPGVLWLLWYVQYNRVKSR